MTHCLRTLSLLRQTLLGSGMPRLRLASFDDCGPAAATPSRDRAGGTPPRGPRSHPAYANYSELFLRRSTMIPRNRTASTAHTIRTVEVSIAFSFPTVVISALLALTFS